jgi:phosphotransferase system HPr-like phosphotransfer protein
VDVARTEEAGAEEGVFTHGLRVRMEDERAMHARPAALLFAFLRRVSPGTRVGFELGGRLFDLGEASQVRVGTILKLLIQPGEVVLVLAAGPEAELVLWAVAEVFAFRPGGHTADWRQIAAHLGGRKEARWLEGEIARGYHEILSECG